MNTAAIAAGALARIRGVKGCTGLFMVSAGLFHDLLHHPSSPVLNFIPSEFTRRMLDGGSRWQHCDCFGLLAARGKRSGAHFISGDSYFLASWKSKNWDAMFYIRAIHWRNCRRIAVTLFVRDTLSSHVIYAAYSAWHAGRDCSLHCRFVIAFVLMSVVSGLATHRTSRGYTGLFAGALVAIHHAGSAVIRDEYDPARTSAPRFVGHLGRRTPLDLISRHGPGDAIRGARLPAIETHSLLREYHHSQQPASFQLPFS